MDFNFGLGFGITSGVSRRYFTTYDPALSQYNTIPTVTAVGDFEIELEFSTTSTGEVNLLGDNISGGFRVYINATTGFITAKIPLPAGSAFISESSLSYADGKVYKALLGKVGDNITLSVGLNSTSSSQPTALAITCDFVARQVNAGYFDGTTSNVNFISGFTQVGNATGNPHYKIAEPDGATVLINSNGTDGNGTIENAPFAEIFTQQANGDWHNIDSSVILELP